MAPQFALLGKYQILEELGRGGFATVYRARHVRLGHTVALKVLDPRLALDGSQVERFWQEARAAATLQHSNVVHVFDVGEDDGRVYLIAEYQPGGSLQQRLERGRLPLAEAAAVVGQVGAGLDYAHGFGLVHRDVKPSNILFDAHGQAKLADFGIAKALAETGYTSTGRPLGTPLYMAPEQAEGRPVDARTDLYALGVVAYEMVTGQVPFRGETPSAVHYQHVHTPPTPPHQVDPALPVVVSEAILKALSKDPDQRYASGAEFAAALGRAIERASAAGRHRTAVEAALAAGDRRAARAAVDRWLKEVPGDAEAQAMAARVGLAGRRYPAGGRDGGTRRVPRWAWSAGGALVALLVLLVLARTPAGRAWRHWTAEQIVAGLAADTATPSPSPSPTSSPTPTQPPSPTATATPTDTPSPTPTWTPMPTPTHTPTRKPSPTRTPSATPAPSETPTPSVTPKPPSAPAPSVWSWRGYGPYSNSLGLLVVENWTNRALTLRIIGREQTIRQLSSTGGARLVLPVAPRTYVMWAKVPELAEGQLGGCPQTGGMTVNRKRALIVHVCVSPSGLVETCTCPFYEGPR